MEARIRGDMVRGAHRRNMRAKNTAARLLRYATSLPIIDEPYSLAAIDVLFAGYVNTRIDSPLAGWEPTSAPSLSAEISCVAAAARRLGYFTLPSMGTLTKFSISRVQRGWRKT